MNRIYLKPLKKVICLLPFFLLLSSYPVLASPVTVSLTNNVSDALEGDFSTDFISSDQFELCTNNNAKHGTVSRTYKYGPKNIRFRLVNNLKKNIDFTNCNIFQTYAAGDFYNSKSSLGSILGFYFYKFAYIRTKTDHLNLTINIDENYKATCSLDE